MEATDGILSLFPFVCGICDAKFNGIANYYSHVQEHSEINEYLHCCYDTTSKPVKAENVYACGKCQLVFPSLCTLYKHLMEDEVITEFIFRSEDKTAYELNEQSDSRQIINNFSAEEQQYLDENVDRLEVKTELCYDSDTDSNSLTGFSVETQKCQANLKVNLFSKKRLKSSCNEYKTHDIDNECTNVCDEQQHMDDSADDFTESGTSSSHDVPAKGAKKKVGMSLERDVYYPCEVCGGFYNRHALRAHKAVHAKRTFQCDQCQLKFSSKTRLNQHTKVVHATESKYTCHECGQSFKALPYLQQHGKIHWQQRTEECQLCHKKYKNQRALRRHTKTHSEARPYQCSLCDKSFKRQSYVQEHEESVHATVGTIPCVECHKMFKSRKAVNKHMHIHKPPKHFCEVCGKSFVYHSNMMIHMKIHSKGV